MKWFKDGTKGICPECGNEIEDVNDKFCSNCGWKISGMKAIKALTEKENGLKSSGDIKENELTSNSGSKELSDKTKKLLEKYGLTGSNHFFECTIEEMRYTTFSNTNQRNVQHGFVGVYDDKLVIAKQGVFIKSDLGSRVVYFKNIASIDYDEKGIFGLSRNLIINMKSNEHVQLKNINNQDSLIVVDTFNKFMEMGGEVPTVEKTSNLMDELLKAKELLDANLLTREEFEKLKQKLLQ